MNLWLSGVIIAAAMAVAVLVMHVIRRRAPTGGFFADTNRASGVFGVVGTAFAVLLAFVIFLGFGSYGNARNEAGREAVATTELFDTAAFFASPSRDELRGELVCYARAVIHDEWRTMRDEHQSPLTEGWVDRLGTSVEHLDIADPKQSGAYDHWFAVDATRQEARRGRLSEASPVIPTPLWIILVIGAVMSVAYVWFYADPSERFAVQALMIGSVTAIVTASILVVNFLDKPYENGSGSIYPVEMERSLRMIDRHASHSAPVAPPCDPLGRPTPS